MDILFTRNNKFGSKLIRSVTGEDVSHVAIKLGQFVVHSKMTYGGVNIRLYSNFRKENTIVTSIKWPTTYRGLAKVEKASYDVGGFFYLGLRILARKWFRLPWPKVNLWQSSGMYLCSELVSNIIFEKEDSMLTPGQLRDKLNSVLGDR